jgi:hypothetical protein
VPLLARAALGLLLLASVPSAAPAASRPKTALAQEYDLKAAFLFNFAQFVEWPADAFATAASPITIGILGEDPFGTSLDEIVANEVIHDRRLQVRRYRSVDQIDACHILFVTAAESKRMDHIFSRLGSRSILTVGDAEDFTARGGVVGFKTAKSRLRIRINMDVARAAKLSISAKLLRQAEIVGPGRAK